MCLSDLQNQLLLYRQTLYVPPTGCVTVLAERLFAPKGRRAVATGGVRLRWTEPVVLACCLLPRPGWGEGSVRMAMILRTTAPAGAVLGVGYSIPRVPLHPACAGLRCSRGNNPRALRNHSNAA